MSGGLSNTLRNLKFMQRAASREDKTKKEEEEVKPDVVSFGSTTTDVTRRCVVIMEGDPHPGALRGRMSFQSFNPSVDKLNEEESGVRQPAAETTISRNQNANVSVRENSPSVEGTDSANMNQKSNVVNGKVKRKQPEVTNEAQYPNKSPKNDQGDKQSSPSISLGSFKKPSGDKLDWSVLRQSGVKHNR